MPLPASPQYSTLELARHDATALGTERDHAVVAPEVDGISGAPQTAPVPGPELIYSDSTPEAVINIEHTKSIKTASSICSQPRRLAPRTRVIISAIVTAVVGVAVGVGVGVGLKQRESTVVTASISVAPTSSPAQPPSKRQVLDDTSLAVVHHSNGDRRLFFQEISGNIRQGAWQSGVQYAVAIDAKNHTPITADQVPLATGDSNYLVLSVYYIDLNNHLACRYLNGLGWYRCPSLNFYSNNTQIANISATADSRQLSVLYFKNDTLLLIYEPTQGDVAMLNSLYPDSLIAHPGRELTANTNEGPAAKVDHQLNSPFSVSTLPAFGVGGVFAGKHPVGSHTEQLYLVIPDVEEQWVITDNCSLTLDASSRHDFDILSIPVNEVNELILVVKGTALIGLGPNGCEDPSLPMPNTAFPFKRLAGYNAGDNFTFSLFHQINATPLAAEQWDEVIGGWASTFINVQAT